MMWQRPADGAKIELTREEVLGLIHVLDSIVEQTKDELEEPSLEHPCHKTEAKIKPLLLKLLNVAVTAEYLKPMFCINRRR